MKHHAQKWTPLLMLAALLVLTTSLAASSDGLFSEHQGSPSGYMADTTGSPGPPVGGPHVAANPEPSTLLLLGTGLVAGVGAIRRRLRASW